MNEPIWKSPGWITALIGLVTAILTVPEIVGNYYTNKQETSSSKQESEFEIVNNTLSQQGLERVFVLRYLAATLDDEEARSWASAEVKRLDNLANSDSDRQEDVIKIQIKERQQAASIASGGEADKALQTEINQLKIALQEKNTEFDKLRIQAGISETKLTSPAVNSKWGDWDFDIFWCSWSGSAAQLQAQVLKAALVADGARGRVRTRELHKSDLQKYPPEYARENGYLVRIEENERNIGEALSVFAEGVLSLGGRIEVEAFVPNETVRATPWYVSIFLCPELK